MDSSALKIQDNFVERPVEMPSVKSQRKLETDLVDNFELVYFLEQRPIDNRTTTMDFGNPAMGHLESHYTSSLLDCWIVFEREPPDTLSATSPGYMNFFEENSTDFP